ncbi:WYL domain-containing protein [Niallia sp. 03091]|uniref:WYL domain-containing protein n=1 Tax=unclassified Niallia TaxID=2837522 RepID=UPI004044AC87
MNQQLEKALRDNRPIEIIYENKNVFTKRVILVKEINETYIKAFCLTKRQPRIFKIDSILAASFVERGELLYA